MSNSMLIIFGASTIHYTFPTYLPILCAVLQGVSAAMTMTHQPTHVNSKPVVMLL